MKKILYLGYYDVPQNREEGRAYSPAAVNKMTYVASAFERVGWNVEIVSACRTEKDKAPEHEFKITENTHAKLFPCMGTGNIFKRAVRSAAMQGRLFFYLLKNLNEETPLLAYHSLAYMGMIGLLKKIKKFKLLLEVEEIYADVIQDDRVRKKEMKLFNKADAFLFPTELLDEKVNSSKKPSAIVYGTYAVEERKSCVRDDGKIHILYAGTFDPRKGVEQAIAAAEYLSEGYHVHIIGFGLDEDVKKVKVKIEKVSKRTDARISYDGLLSGEEYIRFVQSCHVGLSTQTPDAEFNNTSFPSKVLSYLSNGLRVVSIRIKAIEKAKIGQIIYYYDENHPRVIADAILKIDFLKEYNSCKIIKELDENFMQTIKVIIDN